LERSTLFWDILPRGKLNAKPNLALVKPSIIICVMGVDVVTEEEYDGELACKTCGKPRNNGEVYICSECYADCEDYYGEKGVDK